MKTILLIIVLIVPLMIAGPSCGDDQLVAGNMDRAAIEILNAHNKYRAELGIPPLSWSDRLARNAKNWANRLASERRMYHSSGTGEGENLWMGTSGKYSLAQMVDTWGRERKFYKDGIFPDVSTSGNWSDVGHYTQIVWRNTAKVGCAKSTGGGYDYFVCRYTPPGNYARERVY